MSTFKNASFLMSLIALFACSQSESGHTNDKISIQAGQVWKYANRPGDKNSIITILGIESIDTNVLVHIRVDSIKCSNINGKDSIISIDYLVFSEEAILHSITALVHKNDSVPDFTKLRDAWFQSFLAGKTTFWDDKVSGAVDAFCERELNRHTQ